MTGLPEDLALHLLHTSDLHGHLEAMPYVATLARQYRQAHPGALLLDTGDWARGTPVSDMFGGKPMIEIMNAMGYTAAGVGEGDLALGLEAFRARLGEARFPILAANLVEATGAPIEGLQSSHVVSWNAHRLGLIGLTCDGCALPGQTQVLDPTQTLLEVAYRLRAQAVDTLLVLSHLGREADRLLAGRVPNICCILGGHDHVPDAEPETVGGTVLACAGQNAENLGTLVLSLPMST